MKTFEPIDIDAHEWMHKLRLECYRVASLRNMRVGETFWIAYFEGPGVTPDINGHCECYINRIKGGYNFNAIWTIQWGKDSRSHIMTFGKFNLLTGNRIRFQSQRDFDAETSFRKVCRYTKFIARHGKEYGIEPLYLGEERSHKMWRGEIIFNNGYTQYGIKGPEPRGLDAIIETAIALGVVDNDEEIEAHA